MPTPAFIRLDSLQPAGAISGAAIASCETACTATTIPAAGDKFTPPAPAPFEQIPVHPHQPAPARAAPGRAAFLRELYASARQLLPMFVGFAFIGYLINGLIPSSWMSALFGSGQIYSVPLAATLALPLYINTEGSLPLVRAFIDNGMSQGAALAFLIAGSGTSIGAVAGALTIARWRVVALVVAVLWIGAILAGYVYDLFLAL